MKRALSVVLLLALSGTGCATYQYSKNVKMVSFEDDVTKGKSVGPIRGEDCQWMVLGYPLGGQPTLDRAFANARSQAGTNVARSFSSADKSALQDNNVRYINNVSTENDGFNAAGIVAKNCLVVKGVGYK